MIRNSWLDGKCKSKATTTYGGDPTQTPARCSQMFDCFAGLFNPEDIRAWPYSPSYPLNPKPSGLLCMYTSCRFTLQLRLTSPRIIRYNYNMTDVVYRQGYLMQTTGFDHKSQHQLGQLGPIISFNAILEIRCTLYGGRSVLHAGQHLHDSFLFFR